MKKILYACFLFLFSVCIYSQEKTVITVLDFSTNSVSNSDMRSIISLFSSALFRTDKYTVIDISKRNEILKELKFSMSGCSDESCQLEAGKLLSAEQIVVGDIGHVGSRYLLTAKILNTETGKTLKTSDGIYKSLDLLIDDIFNFTNRLIELKPVNNISNEKEKSNPKEEISTGKPDQTVVENEDETLTVSSIPPVSDNNKKIAAYAGIGTGGIGLAVGGYLFYSAINYYKETVNPSYQDYMNATSDFDTYWNTYTEYQGKLKTKAITAAAVTGAGVLLTGLGTALLILPKKAPKDIKITSFYNPVEQETILSFNYSY